MHSVTIWSTVSSFSLYNLHLLSLDFLFLAKSWSCAILLVSPLKYPYSFFPFLFPRFSCYSICIYFAVIFITFLIFIIKLGIGITVTVFANGPGDLGSILGRVIQKTQKWYLTPPCLTLSIIRYGSRIKWVSPRKGVAPSPTLWCSSYRKGSLWVTLDYSHQLYLIFMIIIFFWHAVIWYQELLSDTSNFYTIICF